jgi:hypothetical protein
MLLIAALVLLAGLVPSCHSSPSTTGPRPPVEGRGPQPAAGELQEQATKTERRLLTLSQARAAGTLGQTGALTSYPAARWAGELPMDRTADDWEPAIAADPNAPFVYILHNRYGGAKACSNSCPDPAMILHVSRNGGKTFGPDRFMCECRNTSGQYDP